MGCNLPGSFVRVILGKKTAVVCHFLLQEIFLTQGSNLGLLHWQVGSLWLSHQGGPQIGLMMFSSIQRRAHFGLSLSVLDVLNKLFSAFENLGIKTIFHTYYTLH